MKRLGLAVVACTFALGCHNVDLPDVSALSADGGGSGPYLRVANLSGQKLPVLAQLSFDVEDVDGVASVSLSCGGVTIYDWTVPPYSGQVNLAPCQNFGTANPDGSETITLLLTAIDGHGNSSQQPFTVSIDASSAILSTDVPSFLRPGATLVFHVTSDRPLRGAPTAKVGGIAADIQEAASSPDAGAEWVVTAPPMPLLGIDAYTGPLPAPASVLEEFERQVEVTVDGVAMNGNPTHVDQTVLLSRVQWTQTLPSPIGDTVTPGETTPQAITSPVALPTGLLVPFVNFGGFQPPTNGISQRGSTTYPGFYPVDGGTLRLISATLDGGYAVQGFSLEGDILSAGQADWAFFTADTGAFENFQPKQIVFGAGAKPAYVQTELGQCRASLDFFSDCTGTFTKPQYQCMTRKGATDAGISIASSDVSGSSTGGAQFSVMSAGSLISTGVATCADGRSTWMVGDLSTGQATLEPPIDDTVINSYYGGSCYSNCFRDGFFPIPGNDGTFVVFDDLECTNSCNANNLDHVRDPSNPLLVGPQDEHLGSYAVTQPTYDTTNGVIDLPEVLNVLPDHRLVTLVAGVPNSGLLFWPPDGGSPEVMAVPGTVGFPATDPSTTSYFPAPRDAVFTSRGLAFVAFSSASKRAIIQLDQTGNLRWIYWYPGVASGTSVHIYGSPQSPYLYVTDSFNQRVTAILP